MTRERAAAARLAAVPAERLRIKVYADGAEVDQMLALCDNPLICGFTTNPTLMMKAGVRDYERFARRVLDTITDRPVSFEVLSDDFGEMGRQARAIAAWGANAVVKIPVTNTRGEPSYDMVHRLSHAGVRVNVTAVLTLEQVERATLALAGGAPGNVSVFAGRIADTGRNPVPIIAQALEIMSAHPAIELIWASPRELLNVVQADAVGCHIITLTTDILAKLHLIGRDLDALSLDTVRMFRRDAVAAGLTLPEGQFT
jgi:transaldolase